MNSTLNDLGVFSIKKIKLKYLSTHYLITCNFNKVIFEMYHTLFFTTFFTNNLISVYNNELLSRVQHFLQKGEFEIIISTQNTCISLTNVHRLKNGNFYISNKQ